MQRSYLIFLILLGLSSTRANCQVWQNTYGYNGSFEVSKAVTNMYDNGFIIGVDKNDYNFFLFKPDINGNVLWQKYISNNQGYGMILSHSSVYPDGDILSTGGISPSNTDNSFVLSLNNCGDISWCKTITLNNENYGKFIFPLPNENILLLTYNASEFPAIDRTQLWEIDPVGNIIWMRQILPGTQSYFQNTEFFQMILTADGGSLLSGYTYYPYDTINYIYDAVLQPCLVKCNSQGAIQWVYPQLNGADTNRVGLFRGCTQVGDAYYAVGSDYGGLSNHKLLPLIAKFDLQGNILDYHILLPDTLLMQLTNAISATDTSLLLLSITSKEWSEPNHLVVFITDTLGTYKKSFIRTDLVIGQFGDNVAKMRDNKFVIPCQSPLGWPGPLTDVVAIKLNANLEYDSIYTQPFTYDSLCPYPIVSDTILCNCEPFVSVDESREVQQRLNIMPNPAGEWFNVVIPQAIQAVAILRVYDMFGRLHYEARVPSGERQTIISCENWTPGLYLVKCQGGGKVMNGKVIIK